MTVKIKRIYESAVKADGQRILVDRVWPRGVSKAKAAVAHWLKEVGPSTELRKWFAHDVEKWPEFRKRYRRELKGNSAFTELQTLCRGGDSTLVYSARDERHNQAVVLRELLEEAD